MDISHYESLYELVQYLDIHHETNEVLYSVPIGSVRAGQLISVTASAEFTNPYKYNAMLGYYIVLAENEDSPLGEIIYRPKAPNVTPNQHHGVLNASRQYKVEQSHYNAYINLVAYSGADASRDGDRLIVEQNYGHLDVMKYTEE